MFEVPAILTVSSAVATGALSRCTRPGPGPAAAASGVPQLSQNLLSAWIVAPQLEQRTPNSAPQLRQNRAPSRFSAWHRGHFIRLRLSGLALLCESRTAS